jgi:hypothetical protein
MPGFAEGRCALALALRWPSWTSANGSDATGAGRLKRDRVVHSVHPRDSPAPPSENQDAFGGVPEGHVESASLLARA